MNERYKHGGLRRLWVAGQDGGGLHSLEREERAKKQQLEALELSGCYMIYGLIRP